MTYIWLICMVISIWLVLATILAMGKDADRQEAERRRKDGR